MLPAVKLQFASGGLLVVLPSMRKRRALTVWVGELVVTNSLLQGVEESGVGDALEGGQLAELRASRGRGISAAELSVAKAGRRSRLPPLSRGRLDSNSASGKSGGQRCL